MRKERIKNRISYSLLLITIAAAYVLFHGPELQFVFYLFLLLPLFSFLLLLWQRKRLSVRQSLAAQRIAKGEETALHIVLENRSLLPCLYVELAADETAVLLPETDRRVHAVSPRRSRSLSLRLIGRYRGEYSVGLSAVYVEDMLRLFRLPCRAPTPLTLLVMPQLLSLHLPQEETHGTASAANPSTATGAEDYAAVAEIIPYDPSQEFRKIHWKLTARMNELMVRRFEREPGQHTAVLLDLSPLDGGDNQPLLTADRMMTGAASLLWALMQREGCPVRLVYAQDQLYSLTHSGPAAFSEWYLLCARLPFSSALSGGELLARFAADHAALSTVKTAVVIASEPDDTFWKEAAGLTANGLSLQILLFARPDSLYAIPEVATSAGLSVQTIRPDEPLGQALSAACSRGLERGRAI